MSDQTEERRSSKRVRTLIIIVLLFGCYFTLKAIFSQDGDLFTEFDRRLDAKQLQIIQVAKDALQRPGTSHEARYSISPDYRGGYDVTVWRIYGYDLFLNPQFVLGGYTVVEIDKNLKVVRVTGGL